jgi:hypothetical protein
MKGYILTSPKLIDKRRISFVFFDEANKQEISCQTASDSDAPAMLEKLKNWRHVSIDAGDWITDDKGRLVTLRISSIHKIKDDEPAKLNS